MRVEVAEEQLLFRIQMAVMVVEAMVVATAQETVARPQQTPVVVVEVVVRLVKVTAMVAMEAAVL